MIPSEQKYEGKKKGPVTCRLLNVAQAQVLVKHVFSNQLPKILHIGDDPDVNERLIEKRYSDDSAEQGNRSERIQQYDHAQNYTDDRKNNDHCISAVDISPHILFMNQTVCAAHQYNNTENKVDPVKQCIRFSDDKNPKKNKKYTGVKIYILYPSARTPRYGRQNLHDTADQNTPSEKHAYRHHGSERREQEHHSKHGKDQAWNQFIALYGAKKSGKRIIYHIYNLLPIQQIWSAQATAFIDVTSLP